MENKIKTFMKEYQATWEKIAERYTDIDRGDHLSLVRLLRFRAPTKNIKGPITDLLLPDAKGRMVAKQKTEYGVKILPVVLVLRAGKSAMEKYGIRDGELRMVPSSMVVGMVRNPDFIDVHEGRIKSGEIVQSNIPESLPAYHVHWGRYTFIDPFSMEADEMKDEDMFTFNIPPSFLNQKITLK